MSWSWHILASAVEQKILFPSEAAFEKYIKQLTLKTSYFEVCSKSTLDDGCLIVLLRKQYNYNNFLNSSEKK